MRGELLVNERGRMCSVGNPNSGVILRRTHSASAEARFPGRSPNCSNIASFLMTGMATSA